VTVPGSWRRTLAAYRRAEARVAAFKAEEALLPAARRAYPACRDLEERFGDLDSLRFAALRRLLRLPAPDLPALALKLDLAVADQAWELTGAEDCLAVIAADARRLSANSSA
jgi:type VI protein secretion system component VasA